MTLCRMTLHNNVLSWLKQLAQHSSVIGRSLYSDLLSATLSYAVLLTVTLSNDVIQNATLLNAELWTPY
jgi:hypothetical protein